MDDDAPKLAGVIVTHAKLAIALRDAASRVAGDLERLETVSNDDLTPEELAERVRESVDRADGEGCIVFVDLKGGSCAHACLAALKSRPDVCVISGVNLPMIVDFVLRRKDHDLHGMVERLLIRGRNSIQELKGLS